MSGTAGGERALAPGVARLHADAVARRADWRFLLPFARPRAIFVAADGDLAESVDAAFTPPHVPRVATGAELAVVGAASPGRIARAFAALRPGGACYVEWPAGIPARSIVAQLAAAGFVCPRVLVRWPSPTRCAAWIPIDDAVAVADGVGEWARAARHPLRRAQRALQALSARPRARAGRGPGLVAVAVRPPAAHDVRPWWLGEAARAVDHADAAGLRLSDGASWLLLTPGWRAESRVLGVLSAAGGRSAVVKLPRRRDVAVRLAHEAGVLARLARLPRVPAGVPAPLGVALRRDAVPPAAELLVERGVAGRALDALATPRAVPHLARSATTWLARLAEATAVQGRAAPPSRLATPIVDAFEARFAPVLRADAVDALRRVVRASDPLPLVLEHRDFAPWNVRAQRRSVVGVLDWETAEPCGLPGLDLLYFLALLWASVDGTLGLPGMRASLARARDARTARGALQAECWRGYCDRLGIGDAGRRALRALVWPLHCLSEHRRLVAEVGDPSPADLRRCHLLALWEDEMSALDPS